MTDNRKPLTRRTALKGLATAGVAAAGGAAYLTRGASASSTADYGTVTITSDDGTVEYVALYGDSVVTWDGFDTVAKSFSVEVEGGLKSGYGPITFHPEKRFDLTKDSWGGPGESHTGPGTSGTIKSDIGYGSSGNKAESVMWEVVAADVDGDNYGEPSDPQGLNDYGLPVKAIPASEVNAPTDGGEQTHVIQMETTYRWFDAPTGGTEIFAKTFTSTVDVTVNNEPATVSGSSGDGEDGATGA